MKLLINIICFGVLGYGIILALFYFFQEKFLFFPGVSPFGECPGMVYYGAQPQNLDRIRYYVRKAEKPERWVVVFHGNGGNACERTYFLDLLKGFNANVVVLEYPGYGKDKDKPGQERILEQANGLVEYILKNNHQGLPVYLMGESLGTGVATHAASGNRISGLILFSPYTSIAGVARHHYPWLPVDLLMRHRFQADTWAAQTDVPALLFHGVEDDIIPVDFARKQVLNFKGEKKLVQIPGCGHNDILDTGDKVIRQEIQAFFTP